MTQTPKLPRRCSLYAVYKTHSETGVLLLDCGCYGKIVIAHASMRTVTILDNGGCHDKQHRVGGGLPFMNREASVLLVSYEAWMAATFTPGSVGARMRGCTCQPQIVPKGRAYRIRCDCLQHGSRFGCDDENPLAEEKNTVHRILKDEPPMSGDLPSIERTSRPSGNSRMDDVLDAMNGSAQTSQPATSSTSKPSGEGEAGTTSATG